MTGRHRRDFLLDSGGVSALARSRDLLVAYLELLELRFDGALRERQHFLLRLGADGNPGRFMAGSPRERTCCVRRTLGRRWPALCGVCSNARVSAQSFDTLT